MVDEEAVGWLDCADPLCSEKVRVRVFRSGTDTDTRRYVTIEFLHLKAMAQMRIRIKRDSVHDLICAATLSERLSVSLDMRGKECAYAWRKVCVGLEAKV